MSKDDKKDKDDETGGKNRTKSRDGEDDSPDSDSSDELRPVKSKKGEPEDNLRRRAEWFQKRRSGA